MNSEKKKNAADVEFLKEKTYICENYYQEDAEDAEDAKEL